jgi:hypothetical protein
MAAKGDRINKPIETPDVVYRKLEGLNYSAIKTFDKSPVQFFSEFIMGNPREEEDNISTLIGNIVDDAILTHLGDFEAFEQHFDETYALFQGEPGSGQGFMLADELFKITVRALVDGHVTRSFEDRFREAFEIVQSQDKFKGKTVEQGVVEFKKPNKAGTTPESYFQAKLDNIGKKVVSESIKAKGLQMASNALTDPFTKDYFDFEEKGVEKLVKFPIEFTYKGEEGDIEGKVEVDEIEIDHKNKTIQPIDLKTTYDNTQFTYGYLKNGYYIQAVWYTIAIIWWAKQNGLEDYTVLPYKFIVLDTSVNNRRPLIRTLTEKHMNDGYEGFYARGRYYKGVKELVEAIIFGNNNCIWNVSKEAYENNGVIPLEEDY